MLDKVKNVHFIGVGGYGMSALAQILQERGYQVSGSDLSPSTRTKKLEAVGVKIFYQHTAENLNAPASQTDITAEPSKTDPNNTVTPELVIYSTAIPEQNPELVAARQNQLPLWHRSELLAAILNENFGIAVTGAHGKTTTTAMLSLILAEAGEDPTCVIGGELPNFGSNARVGNGRYVVAEACESDHSFLRYHPELSVITNIEPDHLEYYNGSFAQLLHTYKAFIANVGSGGCLFLSTECPHHKHLLNGVDRRYCMFGFASHAHVKARQVEVKKGGSRFLVDAEDFCDIPPFPVTLQVPGEHNVLNALAAAAVSLELGIAPDAIQSALEKYIGAKRRFTKVGDAKGVVVIDDYAHHPTEIKATLKTARAQSDNKVIAIFQPHRYTRTMYLMDDFAQSFTDADMVILHGVYAAGEAHIEGADSARLQKQILAQTGEDNVRVIDNMDDIVAFVSQQVAPGDYVVTMGAGDIWKVSEKLVSTFNEHPYA